MNNQLLLTTILTEFENVDDIAIDPPALVRSADMEGDTSDFFVKSSDDSTDPGAAHLDGDYTITAWIRPTSLDSPSNSRGIISKGVDLGVPSTFEFALTINYSFDTIEYYHSDGTTLFSLAAANSSITNETWHFISITFDGSTGVLSLAIDDGTPVTETSVTAMNALTADLRVGSLAHTGVDPFLGQLAAIGIWDRIVTDEEITAIYNSGKGTKFADLTTGEDDNLLTYIDLDEASTGVAEVVRATQGPVAQDLGDDQQMASSTNVPGS